MLFYVEHTLNIFLKITIIILILTGVFGQLIEKKKLIGLGWLGMVLFLPASLLFSLPDPDIIDPIVSSRLQIDIRYITILLLSACWVWLFFSNSRFRDKYA